MIQNLIGRTVPVAIYLSTLLICLSSDNLHASGRYSEYWQNFFWKMWENEHFTLKTYVKIETGDQFKGTRSIQINEQFAWKGPDQLSLGLHYAYVHEHSVIPNSPWRWQHRFEFESNTAFHIADGYFFKTRNRFEVRKEQGVPHLQFRLRQRTIIAVSFGDNSFLKTYTLYNELFYTISDNHITQNRVCPIQLTFRITDQLNVDAFFMMRFFNTNSIWSKSAVLGTQLNF
jgi:hypothetical protein